MKKSIFLFFAAILCAMTANAAYNQSAKDLYFDNSEAKWNSCYVYIGHGTWTSVYPLTRVSGTQYLWKLAKADFNGGGSWNGATGWVLCYEKWWDSNGESIDKYTWHGDKNVTQKTGSAWVDTKIYKTNGTASTTSDSHTIQAYKVTSYTKADYTVTINTVEGGTLTVKDYDNNAVATGASKIHLTVLKFSATPADGYVLDAVEINDGTNTTTIAAADLATKTHTLTSAVTITPVWRATTSTVTVTATATNGTVTGGGVVEEGTSVTLTATPADGYKFVNWTVGGAEVSTANPYTFTADADVEVVANFEELPKATIYFVNNDGWSKVQAYAWGTGGTNASWAGVDITANKLAEKIGEYDVYSYTVIQGSYANVIFNDGSSQTADYVWTDGNYYWYDSAIKNEDKFAGGTKEQAETALGALVNYDYYLTGSLVGGWDVKQQGIEKDGELYKATFTELNAGIYEFKITAGDWEHQWNYNNLGAAYEEVSQGVDGEGNPNGNIKIVTEEAKNITVIFDATAGKITFEGLTPYVAPLTYTVTVPAGTEKCFIAGAMNGWNFQEMTATANANEFTIEIAGARETDGYKYACQASWDYVEKKEDGNDLDANRTWTANDVVAKWGVPPTYTIVGATAITGANWDLANEANKMIKDGEAYTLTKTGLKLETGDYEYKVAKNGAWGDGQYPAEGNQKVTITETAEYTIVYTYTVGTSLTAVATKTGEYTPVQTVYTVAGDAALCGTDWKADDAANDMTANGDGTYTWTKADVKLTSDVGFKVVKNHDFGNGEYPAENWNINLANYEGAAVYTVTITFTESSKEIAVTLTKTGEATPPVITYVLMGVADDWSTGIAMTRNEANTEFEEYMLLSQAISATDAVKVVKLVDGVKNTFCGDVKEGSAEHTADADGNIVLAEGTYDFYYDVPANKVYIGKQVAPTELFCEDATVTLESGSLMIQAMWGERQVLVSLQQTTTQGTGTYEAADVYGMLMNPWAELSAVNDECTYQEMGETFSFSGLLNDGTVTYDVWIKGSTASATPETNELEAKDEVYFTYEDGEWMIEAFADDYTWGLMLAVSAETDPETGENLVYGQYVSDLEAGIMEEVAGTCLLYFDDYSGCYVFKGGLATTSGNIYPTLYASSLDLTTNDLQTGASWHGEIAGVDYYEVLMAAADYSWELDLHARNCTGNAGTYTVDVVDEAEGAYSTFMGSTIVTGELTITEDNGDLTYEGEVYTKDSEGNQAMTITFTAWQLPAAAYVINIDDATVIEDLSQYGSSWSMKGEVELEGTTYPVTVEIADEVDLTVPSADVYLSVTVEDFGFVDGNATLTINGNTMAVEGELENTYAGVKFVFNISGTLPTCANIRLQTGNNAGILAAADGKQVNVTVSRNFTANDGYYTLCVPFDMPASVIGKAYQIDEILGYSATGLSINFEEVTTILAGQPYLIEPATDLEGFTVNNVTIDNSTPAAVTVSGAGVSVTMQGKYSRDAKTDGSLYWVGNNGYLYNDPVWPTALCAYFTITTPSGIAPRMRVVTGENEATGVDNITTSENAVKTIVNGQLVITIDGVQYNAMGVKL